MSEFELNVTKKFAVAGQVGNYSGVGIHISLLTPDVIFHFAISLGFVALEIVLEV